jgi:hypothetical protein
MMNLYVDDVREPYTGYEVVRTVEDAQRMLASQDVNRCSLDHDMGACDDCVARGKHVGDMVTPETTFMNWCPHVLDGTKLVQWMIETGNWPRQKPEVHSANPAGRMRMAGLIERYWPERTDYWPQLPDRKVVKLDA